MEVAFGHIRYEHVGKKINSKILRRFVVKSAYILDIVPYRSIIYVFQLGTRNPFIVGDSAQGDSKAKLAEFLERLDRVASGEVLDVHIILDDPAGNSYLQVSTAFNLNAVVLLWAQTSMLQGKMCILLLVKGFQILLFVWYVISHNFETKQVRPSME